MPWLSQLPKTPLLQGFPTRHGEKVQGIVIHATVGGGNVATLHRYFAKRADRGRDDYRSASYHIGIGREGEAGQFRDTDSAAWHAGGRKSYGYNCGIPTPGLVNDQTIGIGLCNWGYMGAAKAVWRGFDTRMTPMMRPENGGKPYFWEPYSLAQLSTLCETILLLREVHTEIRWLSGHSDHVKQKADPGPHFPWASVCGYVGLPRARHNWQTNEWSLEHD